MLTASSAILLAASILISSVIRMIQTDIEWKAVDQKRAMARDVMELSGIETEGALQDIFGPPRMGGTYPLTRSQILKAARPIARLTHDVRLDVAGFAIALLSFFWSIWAVELLLILAGLHQGLGWAISIRKWRQ